MSTPAAAFYCVADERYFPGAVAMINSLRLHGHSEPVYLLDCGLTDSQRALVAAEATVVERRGDAPAWLQKTAAPLRHPAEVAVLIDADMIATRPLAELIELAAEGRVVAFENDQQRFVSDWGELLDLGRARPRTYVSSGLVMFGGEAGHDVLRLLDDRQDRVDVELTFARRNVADYPFLYPEQDVLNAILCTRANPRHVVTLERRLAATLPFEGLRISAVRPPSCSYADGSVPYLLHHFDRRPWLQRMRSNVYSRLLAGLLLDPDLPLRLDPQQLPSRLRIGPAATAERIATDLILAAPGLARRLRQRRANSAQGKAIEP